MGIEGINAFLKSKNVECFMEFEISRFEGKTIVIDTGKLFVESACRIHKAMIYELKCATDNYSKREFSRRFISDILITLFYFIQNGIKIIVILDGERHPAKDKCRKKRQDSREKIREKIRIATEEYELAMENPLEIGINDNYDTELKKLRANNFFFDRKSVEKLKEVLDSLGICHITAEFEAESLCCSLIQEKKAYAVYTSDTDCYAFGVKFIITKINMYRGVGDITNVKKILKWIKKEFEIESTDEAKFILREFCIMCGCDFNSRISGIGPVRSLSLLKNHGKIKKIKSVDTKCLNYKESRKLLSVFETGISEEDLFFDENSFVSNCESVLETFSSTELSIASRRIVKKLSRK